MNYKVLLAWLIPVILLVIVLALIGIHFYVKYFVIWPKNANNYAPYNYPGSTWICDEPKIEYIVPTDNSEPIAKTVIDGEEVFFEIGERRFKAYAYIVKDNVGYDRCFSGFVYFRPNEFVIEIDKSSDILFKGEYSELVFHRVMD